MHIDLSQNRKRKVKVLEKKLSLKKKEIEGKSLELSFG